MIERKDCPVSLVRQCELLLLARSSVYYQPVATSDENLHLMRLIDQQYLLTPFYGSRRMTVVLQNLGSACRTQGYRVNRKRVQRLMRLMGLEAIYPKPNTSKSTLGHRIYPYLLRGLAVERVNQVWSTDITYVPMRQGFLYLVALIDWHSRYVLSWRLSNTLDVSFCLEALQEALKSFGTPEIFNSDQGSQFTSEAFTSVLIEHGVAISMDGRGRCLDNVFVERLWRSVKYEEVYLKAYSDGLEAYRGIGAYLQFFNRQRPHQSLRYQTPEAVYRAGSLKACLEATSTKSITNS
jgi:putative transposase